MKSLVRPWDLLIALNSLLDDFSLTKQKIIMCFADDTRQITPSSDINKSDINKRNKTAFGCLYKQQITLKRSQ